MLPSLRAALLLALLIPGAARTQESAGDHLRIYLATYGQGDAVWELFGHNSIWVRDTRTGDTRSYNWGTFDFNQPGFTRRLIEGNMLYSLAVNDARQEVAYYQYVNRSITVQELNLTPAQKLELERYVEWNALPENRYYVYHYYRDNCSTRVRDVLDRVLHGQLALQLHAVPTSDTFHSESLRLTGRRPLPYLGIELGIADSADHRLTAWEDAFVPMNLMRSVRAVMVSQPGGNAAPLVATDEVLFQSDRPPPLARAPNRVPTYLALGTLIGLLFVLLSRIADLLARRRGGGALLTRLVRWKLALVTGLWSLVVGLFGVLLVLLWTVTGHTFTYGNENLFQVNPLSLLLAVLAPLAVLRGGGAARAARVMAGAVAGLSVLGLVLKVLPQLYQMNYDILALAVPAHLGFLAALLVYGNSRDTARSAATDG